MADDDCPICLSEVPARECVTLDCQHSGHQECLERWFSQNPCCPICRAPVTVPEIPNETVQESSYDTVIYYGVDRDQQMRFYLEATSPTGIRLEECPGEELMLVRAESTLVGEEAERYINELIDQSGLASTSFRGEMRRAGQDERSRTGRAGQEERSRTGRAGQEERSRTGRAGDLRLESYIIGCKIVRFDIRYEEMNYPLSIKQIEYIEYRINKLLRKRIALLEDYLDEYPPIIDWIFELEDRTKALKSKFYESQTEGGFRERRTEAMPGVEKFSNTLNELNYTLSKLKKTISKIKGEDYQVREATLLNEYTSVELAITLAEASDANGDITSSEIDNLNYEVDKLMKKRCSLLKGHKGEYSSLLDEVFSYEERVRKLMHHQRLREIERAKPLVTNEHRPSRPPVYRPTDSPSARIKPLSKRKKKGNKCSVM